ncbi:MAG: thermonuclease family protein [Candidatus Caenarcaniphilales bacterium]|nr:thermonuclease family protein [Candidatus Caenarcaniphilales bacterium]
MKKIASLIFIIFLLSSCNSNNFYGTIINIPDGDTIKVQTKKLGTVRVRLLGIDCPEINQEPWGKIAKEYLEEELSESKTVKLEIDLVKRDKYGRLLAYVYAMKDKRSYQKTSLNEKLLEHGLAELFIIGDNDKYALRFKEAEAKAKQAKINIWDEEKGIKYSPYEFRKRSKKLKKKKI